MDYITMNSLVGRLKGFFSEPIQRRVIFLGLLLCFTSAVLLSIQETLHHLIAQKEQALANQRSRREIGKVLIAHLMQIELGLHDLYGATDARDLKILQRRISEVAIETNAALKVLQHGGTFEYTLPTNFQQINQITQKILYRKPLDQQYVIEVIDITPKIIDMQHIVSDLKATLELKLAADSTARERHAHHGGVLFKQARTVLSRSRENANKIFHDTQIEIERLTAEIAQTMERFTLWRSGVLALLLIFSLVLCWRTLFQISRILRERSVFSCNLQQAHESINHMLHAMPVGIVIVNHDHRITMVNNYAVKLLKADDPGDLIGRKCNDLFCQTYLEICPLVKDSPDAIETETTINALDGGRPIVLKKAIAISLNNEPVLLEAFIDISDRKQAEQALREQQNFINSIFQSVTAGIVVVDPKTKKITDANAQAMRTLETDAETLIGQPCRNVLCARNDGLCPITDLDKETVETECDLCTLTGQRIPIIRTVSKARLNERECIIESFMDVRRLKAAEEQVRRLNEELEQRVVARTAELAQANTDLQRALSELKETQAHLLQSEKMASIGQLAAGVAHEINNPVGFVHSNLNTINEYHKDINQLLHAYDELTTVLAQQNPAAKERIQSQLDTVGTIKNNIDLAFIQEDYHNVVSESLDGLDRVINIVADLKNFAHVEGDDMQWTDLNEGIERTLNIVWNELKYKAEVIKALGELPDIKCYPQKINQVIMNLLVNAAQALEDKGQIRVETVGNDRSVTVTISDTGSGISTENLNRIFDPFFTTKEVGKGTGLGLHVVYNIIHSHNGTIEVSSQVGEGTTFTIDLPIDPDPGSGD